MVVFPTTEGLLITHLRDGRQLIIIEYKIIILNYLKTSRDCYGSAGKCSGAWIDRSLISVLYYKVKTEQKFQSTA